MSENREDEAPEGGARIEDLPASDSELAGEEGGQAGAYTPPIPLRAPQAPPDPEDPEEARSSSPPPDPGE